jgi:hypothetical protein
MKRQNNTRWLLAAVLFMCGCADDTVTARSQALQNRGLVISEVYPVGGFSGTSAFKNDFVELHNTGATDQSLAGLSLQIGTSASWFLTPLPDASLPSGGFFLIQYGGSDAGINPLPAPDLTVAAMPALLASTQGRVALIAGNAILPSSCPIDAGDALLDFVAYANPSDSGTCFLGTGAAPSSGSLAVARKQSGIHCDNSNDNALDFSLAAPTPQNTSSASVQCSQVIDAGSDAGIDAGEVADAGPATVDAGQSDAGDPDSGPGDAGNGDAGRGDAGTPATEPDSGQPESDAGSSTEVDAGGGPAADAGFTPKDAGLAPDGAFQGTGCGCNSESASFGALLGLATLLRRVRRRLQK